MNPEPEILPALPAHHLSIWVWAATGSLLINLAMFALMPYLLNRSDERPVFEKLIPRLNIIRLKRPEPPVERREAELPEPVRPKTAPPPPASGHMAPANLKLSFEINPRLSGGPVVVAPPPVRVSTFDQTGVPSMVADAELDHPLMPLSRLPPVYPMGAKRRGIEGWVKVRFVVDPQGGVQEVNVIEARPSGIFDDSVTRCVRGWRFKPGTVGGTPVSAWAETTVRFELE